MIGQKRVVVLGLDGLDPELVYRWTDELPNLKRIMENGIHGKIESTIPPTALQTWSSLISGKNPGHFGFWDSAYRDDYSYGEPCEVTSMVRDERAAPIYKILSDSGKRIAIVNLPGTTPAPPIPHGFCIADRAVAEKKRQCIYPDSLAQAIKELIGEYSWDDVLVKIDFQKTKKERILQKIACLVKQRFDLTRFFIENKECDFVFTVVKGLSTIANFTLTNCTKEGKSNPGDSKNQKILLQHYQFLDHYIGKLSKLIHEEGIIIIVSAYSIRRFDGTINLNEWLIQEGYLTLRKRPVQLTSLVQADVDWKNTRAWSIGCQGKIYLNIKGREPQGVIEAGEYEEACDELVGKLESIPDAKGNKLRTHVYKRTDIQSGKYAKYGPDLFVGFDDWHRNTSELIGFNSIYSCFKSEVENGGCHAPEGFLAIGGSGGSPIGEIHSVKILDIAPTILSLMRLQAPQDMEGNTLIPTETQSTAKEDAVKKRLSQLGYLG